MARSFEHECETAPGARIIGAGVTAPPITVASVGDAIVEVMARHARARLTVLCGHVHGGGEHMPLPNVRVITGAAKYGAPKVQGTIEAR